MPVPSKPLSPTLEQRRALRAYQAAATVEGHQRPWYQAAVNDFGAILLRDGLCAALAAMHRRWEKGGEIVCQQLAQAELPGVAPVRDAAALAHTICGLEAPAYMRASRAAANVAAWLKRAADASFAED